MEDILASVKELCYKCQFKKVIAEVDGRIADISSEQEFFQLQLFKSQALFEMHEVDASKKILRSLTGRHETHSENYLYVMAKIFYTDQDLSKAERLFKLLADRSENVRSYFKALLGLANVYFSQKRMERIPRLINELEEVTDMITQDQKLRFTNQGSCLRFHMIDIFAKICLNSRSTYPSFIVGFSNIAE